MRNSPGSASVVLGFFLLLVGCIFVVAGVSFAFREIQFPEGDLPEIGAVVGPLIMVMLGLVPAFMGWSTFRTALRERLLETRYPDQPWMLRDDWASGRIYDEKRGDIAFAVIAAVLWNTVSSLVIICFVVRDAFSNHKVVVATAITSLVGVGIIAVAVHRVLRWRKYGTSVFEMAKVPGVIGGNLGGLVKARVQLVGQDGFSVQLRCIHRRAVTRRGTQCIMMLSGSVSNCGFSPSTTLRGIA